MKWNDDYLHLRLTEIKTTKKKEEKKHEVFDQYSNRFAEFLDSVSFIQIDSYADYDYDDDDKKNK